MSRSQWNTKTVTALFCSALLAMSLNMAHAGLEGINAQNTLRLEKSLQRLAEEREALRKKIAPLNDALRGLKKQEATWRNQYTDLQSNEDSKTVGLMDLKKSVEAAGQELDHLESTLVREFLVDERSSLPVSDPNKEALRKLDLRIETGEFQGRSSLEAQLLAVSEMVNELPKLFGGRRYQGRALESGGTWIDGEVLDLGPEQFFRSIDNHQIGRLKETDNGQAMITTEAKEIIGAWFNNTSPNLSLDVSGGDALKVASVQTSTWEHVKKGGIWVYPIMGFAALAALVATLKMLTLYSTSVSNPIVGHSLARCIHAGKKEEALTLIKKEPRVCQSMWTEAVERGCGDPELSEDIMVECMMSIQPKFERFLSFIAVTAAIAPLLGLLGTVTGIIKTFQMMEVFGAGDPKPLIGGISEALITTELGLILAIPALLLHALLSRRAHSLMAKMERASVALVNGLMREKVGVLV